MPDLSATIVDGHVEATIFGSDLIAPYLADLAAVTGERTVRLLDHGGATIDAMRFDSATGAEGTPTIAKQYRFKVPTGTGYATPPTVSAPTLQVDDGTPYPINDNVFDFIDPEQLTPGNFVTVQWSTAFGGVWTIVSPPKADETLATLLTEATVSVYDHGGATINAMKMDSLTGDHATPSIYHQYRFKVPTGAGYATAPTVSTPTLQIDGGAALTIYDPIGNAIDAEQLTPGNYVTVGYSPSFGGYWPLVSPRKTNRDIWPLMQLIDAETGTDTAYDLQSVTGSVSLTQTNQLYWFIPGTLNGAGPVTVSIDGGADIDLTETDGGTLAAGRLVPGILYVLRYNPAGGDPYFAIKSPLPSSAGELSYIARQEADQARRSAQANWEDANGAAFAAIPRTTVLNDDFATNAHASRYYWNEGTTGGDVSDVVFTWNAGGYIEADYTTGDGLWWDPNHIYPGPGHLQILMIAHTTAHGAALPTTDVENAILTIDLRLLDFTLPAGVRLMLLSQWNDGTYSYNFVYTGQLIDDLAGFQGFGLGFPNIDTSMADSGPLQLVAKFAPCDALWRPIGWSSARTDLYRACAIGDALQMGLQDFLIVALHPQQPVPNIPPTQKVSGTLRIDNFKLETPT